MAATLPSTLPSILPSILPSTLPRPDCHMDRSASFFKVSDGLTDSDLSMSATLPRPDCHTDRRGSFFKLIDTFALEIGELKQEMVQTSPTEDRDPYPMVLQGLEGEVSGVYLQSSPCAGASGERDSGYDSLRRRMSVLDRLRHTHPVWLLLTLSDKEATRILLQQPPGVFLVRKSSTLQRKVLSLRVSDDDASGGAGVCDFPVRESQYTFSLEGSGISFADLFRLVAFYCISRDVLPFTLNLPEAIAAAKTQKDLEEVAQLGAGTTVIDGDSLGFCDMSISTSSSDSLDYSHPPLSLPASPPLRLRHHLGNNEDSSDDEDLCDEEEEDYGVSLENDLEQGLRPPFKARRRGVGVGVKVALSFRKVSGVFSTFMTPERRAVRRIAELSRDKSSYFGCLVQDYISFVQENKGCHTSGLDLLQTLRQFMTQMKAYLTQSSELDPPIESLIPEDQIDSVLEKAMHKCVLKPLKGVVEVALHDFQVSSGGWQQLRENLALAKTRRPQDLGVDGAVPPDPMAIEKIRHKFHNMRKMYSPDKKVSLLLRVCKLIYTIMQDNSGRMYGADDFLPMLTYVLAQCDMPQLDTEILYMMELLDPSLLHGEGGYYLTSAYGAMALIKNFQEEQAARVLSSEARDTLHQWHRRRTAQRTAPSVDDFQNYLRVALQEVNSGCTAKTLLVHPYSTTEEVCSLCTYKFNVHDPENHALFLITEATSQQLAPDTHPQRIKAEIHSHPNSQPFHFVYRRVPNLNLCIPAIPANQHNGNCLANWMN
uniref:Ras and Rab interactor 2 n=1 Tax=Oncorhynchus tshawytscha TaxID=74940 RepID=A0A8C8HNB5_ONCTS